MNRAGLVIAALVVVGGCKAKEQEATVEAPIDDHATSSQEGPPPPEQDEVDEDEESGGSGQAMALDEGKMGKKDSSRTQGQYKMKGSGAQLARKASDPGDPVGTEDYAQYPVNPWVETATDPLSTFAADVDTASYAICRRKIVEGTMPPVAAVRVEEWVNYFDYGYPAPEAGKPFGVTFTAAPSPFGEGKHLARIGVQARRLPAEARKPAHIVFLVDVSGSMVGSDRLPIAQKAMRILVDNLGAKDTVALVTYAGNTRVVLEPTGLDKKAQIHDAIEQLTAGGSTAMDGGLELAYGLAAKQVGKGSVSRVIVLSDGDANVGAVEHDELLVLIAKQVKKGVTLSTIGVGNGNYKDELMEQLANQGNGNYYYIDTVFQAQRVFQEQLGATLEVVARDMKLQVDWDPKTVARYRLIGYENRDVADSDFRNDKVDAGEVGSGHSVTAVYELELVAGAEGPLGTVRLRAKPPTPEEGEDAAETAYPLERAQVAASFDAAPEDFRFAIAVAATAEKLRHSDHAKAWTLPAITKAARAAQGKVAERREFVDLLDKVVALAKAAP